MEPLSQREAQEMEALALAELTERQKSNPLYFYRPHPKGATFHRNRAAKRFFLGGNRSGKSEAGVVETASYALGYRPWMLRELNLPVPEKPWARPDGLPPEALTFNTANIRTPVPLDVHIITGLPLKKGIGEIIHPKIRAYLGPCIAKERIGHGGTVAEIILKNKSRIVLSGAEQDAMAFEGTNYGFIHMDEPVPRTIWPGIMRSTVDQAAPVICTFTPLGANAAWLFHDFVAAADGQKVWAQYVSIFDNPYLPPEAIEEFLNDPTLSDSEKEARIYGRFSMLSDRIYTQFSDDVHIIQPLLPPADWVHGMVVDPHQVRPWAIAYFAVSPRGDIVFYREWPEQEFHKIRKDTRSMEEYAILVRTLDGNRPIQVRLIDPNAGPRKDMMRGVFVPSFVAELSKYDLHFNHQINDDLDYGEALVKRLLAYDPRSKVGVLNRPRLYFTSDCRNCIASMRYYSAKTKPGTLGEPDEEKRDQTFKDFADLVRYVAVSGVADIALHDTFSAFMDIDESSSRSYSD